MCLWMNGQPEPIKALTELVKAQQAFHAVAADTLQGIVGEVEDAATKAEANFRCAHLCHTTGGAGETWLISPQEEPRLGFDAWPALWQARVPRDSASPGVGLQPVQSAMSCALGCPCRTASLLWIVGPRRVQCESERSRMDEQVERASNERKRGSGMPLFHDDANSK